MKPLRRVVKATMWDGHGPLDQWKTQGYWFEMELECGHASSGRRIPAKADWTPSLLDPPKRVRCGKCAKSKNGKRDA